MNMYRLAVSCLPPRLPGWLIALPIGSFLTSFLMPVGVAANGEVVDGIRVFLQGGMVTVMLLGNLLTPSAGVGYLAALTLCWLANFIFIYGLWRYWQGDYKKAVLAALVAGLSMSIFLAFPQAGVTGLGEGPSPIALQSGYFMWLAASWLLALLTLARLLSKRVTAKR